MRLLEIKTEESCMIVNNNRTNSSNLRQWHPAFFADIQIELEAERENLIFENEHQLGTKPMEIDALVIKKKSDIPINKNIGRIFRKYNIIEYKSPTDYISINDFYKDEKPLGECVLVIEGRSRSEMEAEKRASWEEISIAEHVAMYEQQGNSRKDAMKLAAKDRGVSKRDIYKALLDGEDSAE